MIKLICGNCESKLTLKVDDVDELPAGCDHLTSNYCPICHADNKGIPYCQYYADKDGISIQPDKDAEKFNDIDYVRDALFNQIAQIERLNRNMSEMVQVLGMARKLARTNKPVGQFLADAVPEAFEPTNKPDKPNMHVIN